MFPLFASRFLKRDDEVPRNDSPPSSRRSSGQIASNNATGAPKPSSLRALDLQILPRDDGPPTELRRKKEKLAHYETQCSHVGDRLFVGGEVVAKSLDILLQSDITHVVNCVGFLYPAYFESNFSYQTLYLQDTPGEDITSVLYDVFDFIDSSPPTNGRVFIHCSQGVSRSTTLAIAYRMWKENRTYEDVFAEVKQMRGVANPNIGFICQLLQWHKRRTEDVHVPRLYRMTPQSPSAPLYLVPKNAAALDPRGAFVLHADNELCVWTGKNCPEAFHVAALHFAGQLHCYEGASALPVCIQQGQETEEFWNILERVVLAVSGSGASTPPPAAAPGSAGPKDVRAVPSYDRDFDLYTRALTPSSNDSPCDSARSGRKTPRSEVLHAASPNDRLRKHARSEALERERERSARSSGGSSTYSGSGLGTESARNRALDFQELAVRRMGRPPLTPRSGVAGGGTGAIGTAGNTIDANGSGAAVTHGVSRLGIPRLALSNLGGGSSGGGGVAAMAVAAPALPAAGSNRAAAAAPRTASSIESEDEDEDSDTSSESDASTADGNDEEEEEKEGNGPTAARPMGVPRLNLGGK
ncbi:hypothetical protein Ndes2526B_g00853 [Nannochloris sp. 'desiccata']